VSRSATEVITAVESGETTPLMPSPSRMVQGSTASQMFPIGANRPISAKATATMVAPPAIIGAGPKRSERRPAMGESTVSRMPMGRNTMEPSAAVTPQPPMSDMGRKKLMAASAK